MVPSPQSIVPLSGDCLPETVATASCNEAPSVALTCLDVTEGAGTGAGTENPAVQVSAKSPTPIA